VRRIEHEREPNGEAMRHVGRLARHGRGAETDREGRGGGVTRTELVRALDDVFSALRRQQADEASLVRAAADGVNRLEPPRILEHRAREARDLAIRFAREAKAGGDEGRANLARAMWRVRGLLLRAMLLG